MSGDRGGLVFRVDAIPLEGLKGRRELDSSWFKLPSTEDAKEGIEILGDIIVDFRLDRVGHDVRLKMESKTPARLICARCLKPFSSELKAETRFTFLKLSGAAPSEKEVELTVEDLESGAYEGDTIDLSELLYEQILLAIPIKPLCRSECNGLCPICGADKNQRNCDCITSRQDPRWLALSKLKLDT